jgi:hypothetical protein
MKALILVSFFLFFNLSFCLSADNTLAQKLQLVKQRPLLVELPSMNTKYIEGLNAKGKTDELNDYTAHYNAFIEMYKKAFTSYWTYNKEITFKTADEMAAIISQNSNKYAVIRYESWTYGTTLRGLKHDPKSANYLYKEENSPSKIAERKNFPNFSVMNLYLSEEQDLLLTCRLPVTESLGGIVYTIRQFDFTFDLLEKHPERKGFDIFAHNYYGTELSVPKLKTSIVYIKKEDLDKKTDLEEISKIYTHEYKVVSNEEWENAILEKKQNIICGILLPGSLNSLQYYHLFFVAADGKMIVNIPYNFGFAEDEFKILQKFAK